MLGSRCVSEPIGGVGLRTRARACKGFLGPFVWGFGSVSSSPSICGINLQILVKIPDYHDEFILHIRTRIETLGNKLKSPYVKLCTIFEKKFKCVKGNYRGIHTWKK